MERKNDWVVVAEALDLAARTLERCAGRGEGTAGAALCR